MKNFGAESPRDAVDDVTLGLWADEQGYVCLRVDIKGQVNRVIRLGQPSARDLATEMLRMVEDLERPF